VSRATELLEKIRTRGYWRVLIRPRPYDKHRLDDINALLPTLEQARVVLRGWDYPHINTEDVSVHLDFIEQCTEWEHHLEVFRFYQSGQFVHYAGFPEDWRDQSGWWPADERWASGTRLGIGATIYRFTEVFEFAARLASTSAGDEAMTVILETHGIAGRQFYVDNPRRLDTGYDRRPDIDAFPFRVDVNRTDLLARSREYALRGVIDLFKRCHTRLSDGILKEWQDEVGRER
jgi:hypothetical protein